MGIGLEQIKGIGKKAFFYPGKIIPYLKKVLFHDIESKKAIDKIRNESIVWHVCTPKSASTFLMNKFILSLNQTLINIHFLPSFLQGNKPQVFCRYHIKNNLVPNYVNVLGRQHTMATIDLCEMISDNHVVVCQTRGIYDTIVSFMDHLNTGILSPFLPTSHLFWEHLDDQQKLNEIIEFYVPWHINFLQSWLIASESMDVRWINYQDAVDNTNDCINQIFSKFNISSRDEGELPQSRMRFNKGVGGRGKILIPDLDQERIAEKVKRSDHLNQDLTRFL